MTPLTMAFLVLGIVAIIGLIAVWVHDHKKV